MTQEELKKNKGGVTEMRQEKIEQERESDVTLTNGRE